MALETIAKVHIICSWRTHLQLENYTVYTAETCPQLEVHIVCNPASKSFHEIPRLPGIYNHDIVVMSVDNATQTYKILSMQMYRDTNKLQRQNLFLYESMTSTWMKLCGVPSIGLSACSSIFMKGILYTLFVDSSGVPLGHEFCTVVLYSYDLVTGAWRKIDVDFPPLSTATEENLQLVVSLGSLHMVRITRFRKRMAKLSIWKIVLEMK